MFELIIIFYNGNDYNYYIKKNKFYHIVLRPQIIKALFYYNGDLPIMYDKNVYN